MLRTWGSALCLTSTCEKRNRREMRAGWSAQVHHRRQPLATKVPEQSQLLQLATLAVLATRPHFKHDSTRRRHWRPWPYEALVRLSIKSRGPAGRDHGVGMWLQTRCTDGVVVHAGSERRGAVGELCPMDQNHLVRREKTTVPPLLFFCGGGGGETKQNLLTCSADTAPSAAARCSGVFPTPSETSTKAPRLSKTRQHLERLRRAAPWSGVPEMSSWCSRFAPASRRISTTCVGVGNGRH